MNEVTLKIDKDEIWFYGISNKANELIEVKYFGFNINNEKDIDIINIEIILKDFIYNHQHNDMSENIKIIRTILKDFDEQTLSITYHSKDTEEYIYYTNKELNTYEIRKNENNLNIYQLTYTLSGLNIKYNHQKLANANYEDIESITNEITKIIKQIYLLNNIKPTILCIESRMLIKIYKSFYNENPDFTQKDINIKFQVMIYTLLKFGININENYRFRSWGVNNMPISLDLEQKINSLYPFGEVSNTIDNLKLIKELERNIKAIGDIIREYINEDSNQIDSLINISKFLHQNSFINNYEDTIKDNLIDTKPYLKLIKHIEDKIN